MTNASFNTETATMQTAAVHVREVNSQIQTTLSSLLSRLEVLYSTWQGDAAASFHNLKQRWHDDSTKLNEALLRISEALDKSRTNYAASEEANTTGFTGVAGSL